MPKRCSKLVRVFAAVRLVTAIGAVFDATLIGLVASSVSTEAATARTHSVVSGPSIRIADLFDGTGALGSRILGPAPAPGERIVVERPQLAAIARRFGLDLRSDFDEHDRSSHLEIERPGRTLSRTEILDALWTALTTTPRRAGNERTLDAPARSVEGDATPESTLEIQLSASVTLIVPRDGVTRVDVEALEVDGAGRFSATLIASGEGFDLRSRLVGRLVATTAVPTLTHVLAAGQVLMAEDVASTRVPASSARGDIVRSADLLLGRALRRPVPAGVPIHSADVAAPVVIAKGARVVMSLAETSGLTLEASGEALEDASLGAVMAVRNTASRAVVRGTVTASGRVIVALASPSIRPERETAR